MSYNIPILLVVFKRPDTTAKVFEQIRHIKPKTLYVAADGFREHILGEKEYCLEVKKIVTNIDWECDVKYLFRNENLGSALNVTKAINWVFEHEEQCIILEDDTLPNDSFWHFMSDMLERYKDVNSIMQINGLSPYTNIENYHTSYTFSKCLFHCWGWGTWKRAWAKFDFSFEKFSIFMNINGLKSIIKNPIYRYLYNRNILKHKSYFPKSWDGRWVTSCLAESGLAVVPLTNLVINLGLNHQFASHTVEGVHSFERLKLEKMRFPLKHPEDLFVDNKLESNGLSAFFNVSTGKILRLLLKKPINETVILFKFIKYGFLKSHKELKDDYSSNS